MKASFSVCCFLSIVIKSYDFCSVVLIIMSLFKISVGGQNLVYSGECIQYLYGASVKAGALSFLA